MAACGDEDEVISPCEIMRKKKKGFMVETDYESPTFRPKIVETPCGGQSSGSCGCSAPPPSDDDCPELDPCEPPPCCPAPSYPCPEPCCPVREKKCCPPPPGPPSPPPEYLDEFDEYGEYDEYGGYDDGGQ
ncbi:hypothetical protein BsWGS_02726 [Bradybaena similaris]